MEGLFKRLSPQNIQALESHDVKAVNAEELKQALVSTKVDIDIAHAQLHKLYAETNYVYARLDHMEQSMRTKESAHKQPVENQDGEGGEEGGSTGAGSIIIEKKMFVNMESKHREKIDKIEEAKALTANLLGAIEELANKINNVSSLTESARLKM